MIDYEAMILARQEEEDSDFDFDCRFCKFLNICRSDEELELEHHCYREEREHDVSF